MKPDEACKICLDKGVKVYPVVDGDYHKLEYSTKNKKVRFKKVIRKNTQVGLAMRDTYIYLAKKILKGEKL